MDLVGRSLLTGYGGEEPQPRMRGYAELHPLGVDVKFHGDAGARVDQRRPEAARAGGRAAREDEPAGRVLAESAARDELPASESRSPQLPVRRNRRDLPVADERRQVLPDALHRLSA